MKAAKSLLFTLFVFILIACQDTENISKQQNPLSDRIKENVEATYAGTLTHGIEVKSIVKRPFVNEINNPDLAGIKNSLILHEPTQPKAKDRVKKFKYVGIDHKEESIPTSINNKSLQTTIEAANTQTNINNTGGFLYIPADPSGAAGPNHVVNVVNVSIEFYTKAGVQDYSASLETFFTSVSPANATFDPKVIYDQYTGRFVVVTLESVNDGNSGTDSSSVLVAVSDDSDPNGTWYFTRVSVDEVIGGINSWFDYPGFAVDEEAIYITGNMFGFNSQANQNSQGNRMVIIDKGLSNSGFYTGNTAVTSIINPIPGTGYELTVQPAHVFGSPSDANFGTYLVGYSGLAAAPDDYLQVIKVDNPLTAPSLTAYFVNMGNVDSIASALPDGDQLGTTTDIESNDRRTLNAVLRGNSLWTTTTVTPDTGNPDVGQTTALWVEVDVTTLTAPALSDVGFIGGEDIATGAYTSFPAIAVNDDGGIAIAFSATDGSIYPGSYMALKSPGDAAGSNRGSITIRAGTDYYVRTFGGPLNRWGDYIGVSLDPDGECFWSYNKYAMTRGSLISGEDGRWGTVNGQFCNSAPVAVNDSATVAQGQTITVLDSSQTSLMFNDTDADNFDSQSLNVTPASTPSFGSVTINSSGTFSYTHNNSSNFTDSFDYTICDDGSPSKCDVGTVNIVITPSGSTYTVGGNVTGLVGSVTLQNNGADDIVQGSDGGFTFPAQADGSSYNVSVSSQPATQTCTVTNESGTLSGANITNVTVTCVTNNPLCFNTATAIPDNDANGITTTINIASSGTLSDLDVSVNADHTYVGDLVFSLTHVGTGTTVDLMDQPGVPASTFGCNQANVNTTFNDASGNIVENQCNGTDPAIGTDSRSHQLLSGFNGEDQSGDWNLTISDNATGDTGTLNEWCLIPTVSAASVAVNDSATVSEDSGILQPRVRDNDTINGGAVVISVTQPANGTSAVIGGGTDVSYEPDVDYCNDGSPTDDFTYTLTGGSTATVAVTVTCVDDDATAVDDVGTVDEDSDSGDAANTINVSNNDTDPDGGDKDVRNIISQPANGNVTHTASTITYTPNPDYCNDGVTTDDFVYDITGGSSATVRMTVTCIDDNPVAVNDTASVSEDSSNNSISVLSNDTDIDGGAKNVTAVGNPANGVTNFTSSSVSYTPNPDYCNDGSPTDNFTYTITGGDTATVSVTVLCVDDDPVAVNDSATVAEDSVNNSFNVISNDTDIDGGTKEVRSITQPANGSAVFTTTNVSYSPNSDYCNDGSPTDNFTYTLSGGSIGTVSMTVTCSEDLAVADDDAPAAILEDSGANTIDVLNNDFDVDGDAFVVISKTNGSNGVVEITNAGADVSYTPNLNYCGVDTFTYTITGGDSATVSMLITCVNDIADAVDDNPAAINEDSGVHTIDVLNNDSDAEGDSFVVTDKTDGSNGVVEITNAGTDVSYTPNPNFCGLDSFTYTLTGGDSATVNMDVTCINDPADAVNDSPAAIQEDSGANTIDVLDNDSDVESDPFIVIAKTDGVNGIVEITNAGLDVSYTPNLNYCGDDSFSYTITGNDSAIVSITINCVDDPAVAVDDTPAAVAQDSTSNVIDVLDNDTDVDGGTLNVIGVTNGANGLVVNGVSQVLYTPTAGYCGPDSFTYTITGGDTATVSMVVDCANNDLAVANDDNPAAFDEDSGANTIDVLANDSDTEGDPFVIINKTNGSNGIVNITNAGDDLTYTPNLNFCGQDNFSYTITGNDTATVFVTVNCIDDLPVANDDTPAGIDEDSNATIINVLANDTDVESDSFLVIAKTDGSNGVVAITNSGNDISYTPNLNFCGNDSFSYTITGGDTAVVSISVNCINDPANAVDDTPASINENSGATSIDVLANDSDVEGDSFLVINKTNGLNGNVVITNGGGDVSYTPNTDFCGNDAFTYTITGNDTATVSISVICDNQPAVAFDDTPAAINEDSGANVIDVLANDSDPEDDAFSITGVTNGSNGTVSNLSNELSYTPNSNFCGQDSFSYTITGGDTAIVSMTVNCQDDLPVAENDALSVNEDSVNNTLNVLANDTDVDGGSKDIIAVTQPANASISFTASNILYTPNAEFCHQGLKTDDFTYTITGGDTATVSVTVNCVNDQPSFEHENAVYTSLSDLPTPASQVVVCQFNFGPDNESGQTVADVIVSIQTDKNNILSAVDILNDGSLSANYTGNQGQATIEVSLQDNGGNDFSGNDTSSSQLININVQDYIYRGGFETKTCPQ